MSARTRPQPGALLTTEDACPTCAARLVWGAGPACPNGCSLDDEPDPDEQRHVFATFMGGPATTDYQPVCGKPLTSRYDGRGRPDCPECARILQDWRRTQGGRQT